MPTLGGRHSRNRLVSIVSSIPGRAYRAQQFSLLAGDAVAQKYIFIDPLLFVLLLIDTWKLNCYTHHLDVFSGSTPFASKGAHRNVG